VIIAVFAVACAGSVAAALLTGPLWGWVILGVFCALLLFVLGVFRFWRWSQPAELSPAAKALLRRYGYYYLAPAACRQYGWSCLLVQLTAGVLAIVGAFERFWWGFGLAAGAAIVLGFAAKFFKPGDRMAEGPQKMAHQEVMDYLDAATREART
jgi:hypothetical protein